MSRIVDTVLEWEKKSLSPYATHAADTRGREYPATPCDIRTDFQRDRDRIIHSQSFRRLMYKTQVFLAPVGDHYRTRLTHTLEVTQVARTVARSLRLNEDLTEAIALGHDLGHTPFGHAGEEALRECYDKDFAHYRQSLRVVEKLENDGKGLNLTWEVRNGIVNHTGKDMAATPEGVIVKFADRIAYINHDIDDAIRAGLLTEEEIPADAREILGQTHGERINTLVLSVITASAGTMVAGKPEIRMENPVEEAMMTLRKFLFERVYYNPVAKSQEQKSKNLLIALYGYYREHPESLPGFYRAETETEPVERCVCDYIAGMTDRFAIETYRSLFIPEVWRGLPT